MGTNITNSAFKVKTGAVPNTIGLPPEKGAILFDESVGGPVVGDGFNWLTFTPAAEAVAVTGAEEVDAMTAGVAIEPATFFDTILYNYGTALTPVIIGQTLTINTDGSYRFNYAFKVESSTPNTIFQFDVAKNGTEFGAPLSFSLPKKDTSLAFSGQFVLPGLVNTDELTLWISSNKTATITRTEVQVGMSLVP